MCRWVDFPGMGRVTPLMVAAYFGKGECVRVLLQAGADISLSLSGGSALPLPSGSTAMHCAARGRSTQAAVELLKALVRLQHSRVSARGHLPLCFRQTAAAERYARHKCAIHTPLRRARWLLSLSVIAHKQRNGSCTSGWCRRRVGPTRL